MGARPSAEAMLAHLRVHYRKRQDYGYLKGK